MSASRNYSATRYAVIAGLRTERQPELLVVAYPDEETLRDLIASPSIIALGFSSRDEAVKHSEHCCQTASGQNHASSGGLSDKAKSRNDLRYGKRQCIGSFAEAQKNARRLFQYTVGLGIIILYSRNAASVAIRTFLGV